MFFETKMVRCASWLGAAVMAASLAGCAGSSTFGGAPGLELVRAQALPEPTRADRQVSDRAYYIAPFDKLMIGVFGIEGLEEREVQVDASGLVTFPIIGAVDVGGRPISEVRDEIRSRLQDSYVRDPQVTVNLKETTERVVTIDGQVARPGSYPVIGDMSLLRAVATAGSTTEFAKLEEVILFREVGGVRYAGVYSLSAIRQGAYEDPEVFADDVIVVGDSQSRRLFKDLLQAAPLLTTPLIILFQNKN